MPKQSKNQPLPVWDPPKPWFGSGSADFWLPFGLVYCSVDRILCIFYMLMFSLTWHFLFFKFLDRKICGNQNVNQVPNTKSYPKHSLDGTEKILENLGSENMQSLRLSRRGLLIPGNTPFRGRTETTKAYPKMAPRLELAESCKVPCWCFTGRLAPWRPSVLGGIFHIFPAGHGWLPEYDRIISGVLYRVQPCTTSVENIT